MGLISWIVIGLVVGLVGKASLGRRSGNLAVIAGLAGAIVGGIIAAAFGAGVADFSLAGAVTALVFAIAALVPVRALNR